jgi:hypothetical protein
MAIANLKPDEFLTVAQLTQTVEFRRLTRKQAGWVSTYIQGYLETGIFDSLAATKATYECCSLASFQALGSHLKSQPKIKAVVDLFLGSAHRDIAFDLLEIQRAIDAADPGSIAAQRLIILKARLKHGLRATVKNPAEAPAPQPETSTPQSDPAPSPDPESHESRRFKVGDIVTQDGERYRITAVDENGKPTAVNSLGPIE